jgi:RHS repeat-associated protein
MIKIEKRSNWWGGQRWSSGTLPTTMLFTGQRRESSFGLYYYSARWYDPAVGRFIQADTEIPQQQGVQAWDRFAYTNNNPVKYTDPTGKGVDCGAGDSQQCWQRVQHEGNYQQYLASSVNIRTGVPGGGEAIPALGTVISSNTVLTAGHSGMVGKDSVPSLTLFKQGEVPGQDPGHPVVGTVTVSYDAEVGSEDQYLNDVMTMALPDGSTLPPVADLASADTINSLAGGDLLSVVYYDDATGQMRVGEFEINNIFNGRALLNDPGNIINGGDSGGGVYFNNVLVGNTTTVNTFHDIPYGSFWVTLNPSWIGGNY